MRYQRWITPLASALLLITSAYAQVRGRMGNTSTGNVHVHVTFDDDRTAGPNLFVRLLGGSSSTPIATNYTNSNGQAAFDGVVVGEYHIVVSGDGIQTSDSGSFEVDERKGTQTLFIRVHRIEESGSGAVGSKSSMVSASQMNVSSKARKEVEKANGAMAQQDWKKALERLNKAIAIDPQYAAAYNNLGVLYARMNDDAHEQAALEKAISLDDHFAAAYVNLAKLCLRERNFPKAKTLLEKAVSADPNNGDTLMLLADAQFMNGDYDGAIASAREAHALSGMHPAFVHYIAAHALDRENRRAEALAELQIFLKEEPTGLRADRARAIIQSQQKQAQ